MAMVAAGTKLGDKAGSAKTGLKSSQPGWVLFKRCHGVPGGRKGFTQDPDVLLCPITGLERHTLSGTRNMKISWTKI